MITIARKRITNPNVRKRIAMEKRIVRQMVRSAINAGYYLNVDNGNSDWDEENQGNELCNPTNDAGVILNAMFATDEETLKIYNKEMKPVGYVFFVYGNDGWDVVAEHSACIDPKITEKAEALSDKLAELA